MIFKNRNVFPKGVMHKVGPAILLLGIIWHSLNPTSGYCVVERDKVIFMKTTFEFGPKVFKDYAVIQIVGIEKTETGMF